MPIYNVIKYEGDNSTFVYKHPTEDFNTGSQLIVHESQEAVFLKDGKALDHFGAGKYTLTTESMPLMKGFFKLIAGGPSQFHAEVYFVNLTTIMGVKWGTDSKVRLFDPASGLHIELGASGEFNIRVADSGKVLLKLVGTELGLKKEDIIDGSGYTTSSVSGKFRALIMTKVKSFLPKAIRENNIDILEIDEHMDEISEYIRTQINNVLDSYGLVMPEFFITNILTPDDDPNYRRLKEQHAERYLKVQQERINREVALAHQDTVVVEAETAAKTKIIGIDAEAEARRKLADADAEKIRAEGLAKADAMKAQGYTYQQETQRQIGTAFANNDSGMVGSMNNMAAGVVQAGIGIGAAVSVAKTTTGAVNGMMNEVASATAPQQTEEKPKEEGWKCPKCGTECNTGKFCKECGAPKPAPEEKWTCPKCGHEGNTGKFCSECGSPKPVPPKPWTCPKCGHEGNMGKFCSECGTPKPVPEEAWKCPKCGHEGNHGKFCSECGAKKED